MTLHQFVDLDDWPKDAIGFKVGFRGRTIWTGAYYPDGSSGNKVKVHRIVHERGNTFTSVAFYDRDLPIVFIVKEG